MQNIEAIHDILVKGIRDFFGRVGAKSAVLGLSGGLDSALVAALACEALGAANVTGLLMPSRYSSAHSVEDALALASNLGMPTHTVPIEKTFAALHETLVPVFCGRPEDTTEENMQSRIRAVILMAYSNKFGGLVLSTSNKSEVATGYYTLYGDTCGALAPIADIYKTQAYALARWLNRDREIIPRNTIEKTPSAELRPDQTDQDSLPPYEILDAILTLHLDEGFGVSDIAARGYDEPTVQRVVPMVARSAFKRLQLPPKLELL